MLTFAAALSPHSYALPHMIHLLTPPAPHSLPLPSQEMQEGPWSQQNVDPGSGLVIAVPAPLGGVIVVGRSIVVYLSGAGSQAMRAAAIKQATMTVRGSWRHVGAVIAGCVVVTHEQATVTV